MNQVLHTPTTPYDFDMWTHTYEPQCNVPPSPNNPSATHSYYTCEFDIWMHTYEPRSDVPPKQTQCTESYYTMFVSHVNECICNHITCTHPLLIKPSASGPYYTMSIWHVKAWRDTQMRLSPLIEPSATEPYYTMSVWHVEVWRCTQVRCTLPPAHQSYSYTALLHHVTLTCRRLQKYPGQMYPTPTNQT